MYHEVEENKLFGYRCDRVQASANALLQIQINEHKYVLVFAMLSMFAFKCI